MATTPTPSFLQQLLVAVYGEPSAATAAFRPFDSHDPAALARLGIAVLLGFPKGVEDFLGVLRERLALYSAASRGYVAALLEKPKQPGTVSENNPLILYLAERGQLEELTAMGRDLRALDGADIWTALNALTQASLRAVIGSASAYRAKLLNAKSVDELGDLLGRLWGYVSADAICNALADKAAQKIGRINVRAGEARLAQIDESIEAGYRRSEVYLKVERRFEELARKADKSEAAAAVAVKGTAALPAGHEPALLGAGTRNFSLGDLEPTPGVPVLPPRGVIRTELIATRWSSAEIALIRSNIQKLQKLPDWALTLPPALILEIALVVESNHPRNMKISPKDLELRVSKVAGMIQEIVNPTRPEFGEHHTLLKKLLGEEGRWDLDTLQYVPRLYTLEPDARGLPIARRAEATDGVWVVQPKDKSFFFFPFVYESKSKSNTNNLFYERVKVATAGGGETYGARDPLRAQPFRDVERLSNLDVILEIPELDGTRVRRIHIPAGMSAISRKTTRFALITPRKAESLEALDELVKVGFTRKNIIVLPPAYPRAEIDTFARRLLNAPFDKVIPPAKAP